MFPRVVAAILGMLTCPSVFAQQTVPGQTSSTTVQSTITSNTNSASPAKYYIDFVDTSPPKKAFSCEPGDKKSTLDLEHTIEKHILGEAPFEIHVTASDGCSVKLDDCPEKHNVAPKQDLIDVNGLTVTMKKAGVLTICAIEDSKGKNTADPLPISIEIDEDQNECVPGLVPQTLPKPPKPSSASLIQYLGNPVPFSLQSLGLKILIYSAKDRSQTSTAALEQLKSSIHKLAVLAPDISSEYVTASTKPAYSIVVFVPHSLALGDLGTKLSTANYSDFTIQDVGSSKVRISSATMPDCAKLTNFLRDLRDVAWRPRPESGVAKLFFLNASDLTGALGGSSPAPAASNPAASAATPASQSPAIPASAGTTTATQGGNTTSAVSAASTSSTMPASSPATPAPTAGAPVTGGAPAVAAAPALAAAGTTPAAAAPASATPFGATPSTPTSMVAAVGTDTLLFSDSTPGDDAIIVEKKRLVAALDLPRPEMIINIWSFQTSSTDEEGVEHATGRARNLVKTYNDVLQQAVDLGWEYMKERIDNPRDYFDEKFYGYVTGKFIADPSNSAPGPHPASATAQALLNRSTGTPMSELQRQQRGACKATQYCLGYSRVFQPLRPRLTDLLLAVIAANDPCSTSMVAIDRMEKRSSAGPDNCTVTIPVEASDCVETDLNAERENRPAPRLYIECFRIAATQEFSRIGSQPTPLGLLRSSIADFLFHYKRSIMYSHEFDPYELSQSAQALNTQLSPLIDAFNRDIATFQDAMSEVVRKPKLDPGPWAGADKATFVSNGWITVRSISGVDTIVNTTTQSFLDATQQPTISALLNSIEGVHPGTATPTGSTTPFPDLLQNLSPIQAQVLVGALSSVQTSKVQIGRSLNIDITPRSLAGASAAELTVKINADESAAPSYYTPQSNAPDISRVANHDTTTRVRVDSIKLFDVSTLTAQLQKSRARFPLLPPFVEIPYIGTFIGVPLPSAKEFHSSTVVLSTIIVPTAADIALGLSFDLDRFVDSNGASRCVWNTTGMPPGPKTVPCRLRAVQFLSDLQSDRISSYHKKMISCLAMNAGHPKYDLDGKPSMSTCGDLALENNGLEASE